VSATCTHDRASTVELVQISDPPGNYECHCKMLEGLINGDCQIHYWICKKWI